MSQKRTPIFAAATGVGLAAILIAHSTASPPHLAAVATSPRGTSGTPAGSGPGSPPASSPSSSPAGTAPAGTKQTATGTLEQYGYGELSIKVSVSGSHITATTVGDLQTADSYSQQLAQQVIPTLQNEVLSAQSAQISAVSGATYTSEAFASSVQAALNKLGVK